MNFRLVSSLLAFFFLAASPLHGAAISIVLDANAAPRVEYGATRLADALKSAGLDAAVVHTPTDALAGTPRIVVGPAKSTGVQSLVSANQLQLKDGDLKPEGFLLATCANGTIAVAGGDDSGALYGCLELAARVRDAKKLPTDLHFIDAPAFKMRGPCFGMQKTYLLPGRKTYEYPYTDELFPFFYDKQFWTEYLDMLAANRMNTLFIWAGHPFASLVRVPDYPYALEVSDEQFKKNTEMYRYIVQEADKRGIWVVQMFYNILLSKPFADKNGLATQLKAPTPLAADYTRKSIAEFVKQYPNVGLMVCLGEALTGTDNQFYWATQVIIPGVKDGMAEAGLTQEPPLVVRAHTINDPVALMTEMLKTYHNLYSEAKFNGESLTTWEPRGPLQKQQQDLGNLASTHMTNIHIMANLEPFRYGDTIFIQKSVLAARDRLNARGMHLYPLSYWNWPDAPDKTDVPLKQYNRDWIWFEAWSRYMWNPDRDAAGERTYWIGRLTEMYGSPQAAASILDAYNDSGEIAPRLIRRFGITEGNRQTLSLGMTLDELVRPERYSVYSGLWESQSPPGERLDVYTDREWNKQSHEGETPPSIIKEVLDFSAKAVTEIDAAAPLVTKNREEFDRLKNDVYCIQAMAQNYAAKANAAMLVLRYNYSQDPNDMVQAEKYLAESLDHYRTLAKLTENTYQYANSMQTSQRKIPVSGGSGGKPANYHWTQLLPTYEKELTDFQAKVAALKAVP